RSGRTANDSRPRSSQRSSRRLSRWRRAARWWRSDRGSVAAEATLVTPLLILLVVFVGVVIHRGVDARLRVDDAAHQAARAASLARDANHAATNARDTAGRALADAGLVCAPSTIITDTAGFVAGGRVSVTVSCRVDLASALQLGGSRTITRTAVE